MLLSQRSFFVKERVAVLKLTDTYDILDPQTSQPIGLAREEPPPWAKYLRLLIDKRLLPTVIQIYEREGSPPVLTLRKKPGLLRSTAVVSNAMGKELGSLRSKVFSLGGGFFIHDVSGTQIAELKGDWKGWNFKMLDPGGRELGVITKKWAGVGKELFTSADNYMVSLTGTTSQDLAALLLAAGLAIDIVFKER